VRTLSGCVAGVGLELRRSSISIDQPDPSVAVVIEKGLEIPAWDIARPHHLPVVDVGAVVDPLVVDNLVRRISNNHQLLARAAARTGLSKS
jgi:hypothetical protein